jgi:hypothetical protein
METKLQIAVLERGFIYVGDVEVTDGSIVITDASCIRYWGTTHGLGQLALNGPTKNTKLDFAGTVRVPMHALIHLIDCVSSAWERS